MHTTCLLKWETRTVYGTLRAYLVTTGKLPLVPSPRSITPLWSPFYLVPKNKYRFNLTTKCTDFRNKLTVSSLFYMREKCTCARIVVVLKKVGTSAYNAAIAACGHAGSALDALPILAEMKKRGVPRSVITYRFAREIIFLLRRGEATRGRTKLELQILELVF